MSGMDRLTELLPCPFCGGEVEMMGNQVFCNDCEMGSSPNHDLGAAIVAWNRRAAQAAPAQNEGTDAETKTLSGGVCADLAGSDSLVGPHRALIEQANALLSINASGAAVPRIPNMAADIIKRLVSALTAAPAPSDGLREENERLREENAIMAKALDEGEQKHGLSTNGGFWRFWSEQLRKYHQTRASERAALSTSPTQEKDRTGIHAPYEIDKEAL